MYLKKQIVCNVCKIILMNEISYGELMVGHIEVKSTFKPNGLWAISDEEIAEQKNL